MKERERGLGGESGGGRLEQRGNKRMSDGAETCLSADDESMR